ncbi:hypothetical protein C8R42DRAFT_649884 [Lentinula raphanica]|nr:hypothetical protein C8R42DRAFT_649884 [Lentinula raphanica]
MTRAAHLGALLVLGIFSSGVLAAPTSTAPWHSTEVQALKSSADPPVVVNVLEARGAMISQVRESDSFKNLQIKRELLIIGARFGVVGLSIVKEILTDLDSPRSPQRWQRIADGYGKILELLDSMKEPKKGLRDAIQDAFDNAQAQAIHAAEELRAKA